MVNTDGLGTASCATPYKQVTPGFDGRKVEMKLSVQHVDGMRFLATEGGH
jgi:hypothetical protein